MPPGEASIRRATRADRPALVAFHLALYVDHQRRVVPDRAQPLLAYRDWPSTLRGDVDALLADPGAIVLVAETARADRDDDPSREVIGYITGHVEEGDPRRVLVRKGVVGDWWVEPSHRQRGVGGRLLDALFDAFRARDCELVESQTWPGNGSARRAHEAAGFDEVKVVYRRRL